MTVYETVDIRENQGCADEYRNYIGTDPNAAINTAKDEWCRMSRYDREHNRIEVRVWDMPDDIDLDDEDAVADVMIDAAGFDELEWRDEYSIKAIRESLNLSQSEFANRFNIPLATVQNWEQGRRKCPEYILDLINFRAQNDEF